MKNIKIYLVIALLLFSATTQASCVILVHGLARTASSMEKLQTRLSDIGYLVVNLDYPSRDYSVEILAEKAIPPALDKCGKSTQVNFVTHSLGGILLRQYLSVHEIENLNYVAMLGPPNKGSEVVDKLHKFPGFHFINGDAGMQLGTGELSISSRLESPKFNLGVIAGNKSINLILSSFIPGKDDGKVSVENTKIDGMNDHLEMPVTHPFIMKNEAVISQVIYCLEHGEFSRKNSFDKQ